MNSEEITPKPLQIDRGLYKEGDEFIFDPKITVPEGARRGVLFIGEVVQNRKARFDENLIRQLHSRVLYYLPGVAGQYRGDEEVVFVNHHHADNERDEHVYHLPKGRELQHRMQLFSRWMEERIEVLKEEPEDLVGALKLACEIHYGVTSPQLHPFYDGNGRVARLLANGVLMLNAHEVVFYGIKILPVPLVRRSSHQLPGVQSTQDQDRYLEILNDVHETRLLNQFDTFIAQLWVQNLSRIIDLYNLRLRVKGNGKMSPSDRHLIEKFYNRVSVLSDFITGQDAKLNPQPHIIPDYFELRNIKT